MAESRGVHDGTDVRVHAFWPSAGTDYLAVSVAHEQPVAAERDRAEVRRRSERLAGRVRALVDEGAVLPTDHRIVGRSDAWQRVLTRAMRVAPTDITVFLQGESGTGKEVVAVHSPGITTQRRTVCRDQLRGTA
jgi:DNA-binding NtrC family response regulator